MSYRGFGLAAWVALGSQLLMNAAAFMVVPFLALYLKHTLNQSAWAIGTVLTVMLVASRVLPALTGPLADRVGYRSMMMGGALVRGLGFAGFVAFREFWPLCLMTALIGLGGALYDPAVNAVLAASPDAIRPRVFTLHNQFLNIGVIGGPALGAALIGLGPRVPFLIAAATFFVIGVLIACVRMPGPVGAPSLLHNYRKALAHRPFRAFLGTMALWWILFAQLQISLPVLATQRGGGEQWASLVFLVNGLVGMALGFALPRLYKHVAVPLLLLWGFILTAVSFGLVPTHGSIWWLLGCVVLYTIAETIILPSSDLIIAGYTDHETGATFFGLFALSWAVGGTVGNYLGSWLMFQVGNSLVWLVYAAIGLLGAAGAYLYRLKYGRALVRAVDVPGS